jgi:hypothetical protein
MSGGKQPMPFICLHGDPRCKDDPCPRGIARTLCNAPADHPARQSTPAPDCDGGDTSANEGEGR